MSVFIETSWGSLFKWGEELCGDGVELDKKARRVAGAFRWTGLRRESEYSCGTYQPRLFTSMISAGFAQIKDVVETIASTLPVCKVRQVAYSTFTMMQVDREGNAYTVEFDNPTLILLREGKRVSFPWVEQCISGKQVRSTSSSGSDAGITFPMGLFMRASDNC